MNARKKLSLFLSVTMLIIGTLCTIAYAVPPQPQNLYGTVKDGNNNNAAMTGATITVRLNADTADARIKDNITLTTGTSAKSDAQGYDINVIMAEAGVSSGATTGDVIHVFINGAEAQETKAGSVKAVVGAGLSLNISLPAKTLLSIAVTGQTSVEVGGKVQFAALGTYDDGLTATSITNSVTWGFASTTDAAVFDGTTKGQLNAIKEGSITVKATSGTATPGTAPVTITAFAGTVTVVPSPTSIVADGSTNSAISATVKTSGNVNVVDGVPVTFAVTTGTGKVATASAVTAGGSGVAVTTYTSSKKAGSEVVTATVGAKSGTATVTLTPGAASKINVTASPATITSSIAGFAATVYATIVDAWENIVTSFKDAVTFTVDNASKAFGDIKTGETNPVTTYENGVASIQIASKKDDVGGKITVTADAGNGITGTGTNIITTVPLAITTPAVDPVYVRAGDPETFVGMGGSKNFSWSFKGDTTTTATGETVVWTAPIAAQTVTVTLTDIDNPSITASKTINVYVLLNPVLNTVTTPTRDKQPTMSWGAVEHAVSYDFYMASDAKFKNILDTHTQTGITATSYRPAAALGDGPYYWKVKAVIDANRKTPYVSGTFTVDTTGPAPVADLLAAQSPAGDGDLQITWKNPLLDFSNVIVVAATNAVSTWKPEDGKTYTANQEGTGIVYVGNLETFTDTPLTNGTNRFYTVYAYDALNNYSIAANTDATSADTKATAAPTSPTAAAGNAQVTLSWTIPTDQDLAGFVILMRQGTEPTGKPTPGAKYNVGEAVGTVDDATTVAYAAYTDKAVTTTIKQLDNGKKYYFAIYAVDERPNYSATAATANATPGPPVISDPTSPKDVHAGEQVNFTTTNGVGAFTWSVVTANGGTFATATGTRGENATWTAPATVATSPMAVTIRVTNDETKLYVEGVVNVYSTVAVTSKPTTAPYIASGTSSTFQVAGGDSTYTWTVKDPAGNALGTATTGASFTFTAPTTANFAGVYTITVT
ncbi:MAG: Ig-like domain-containing protein, partial [Deltaproteobacteria bacterium]